MNWVDGKPGTEKQVPLGSRMTGGPNDLGFDYFFGFTHARNIGTIIEQDHVVAHVEAVDNQPRMIEKAPWKQIFFKDGRREFYQVEMDLSETRDLSSDNPEVTERLTHLMLSYIDRGRSTPGIDQHNDTALSLQAKKPKRKNPQ